IVNALFMWTTDNPIGNHDTFHLVLQDEGEYFLVDHCVGPGVVFGKPSLQDLDLALLLLDDSDCNFTGALVVRSVIGDGGDGITSESLTGLLLQRCRLSFQFHRQTSMLGLSVLSALSRRTANRGARSSNRLAC